MDNIVSKIAALGVPGLVLIVALNATGLYGAAAITAALSALGPGGIIGGIATLGVIGLAAEGISKFGFEKIFKAVVKELYKEGESKESILRKINHYPITNNLKNQLKDALNTIAED